MINEIINLMAECLEKEPGEIKATDEFREYEEWDSLAYLSVIAKIDEDYHLVIPRDEFQKIRTIEDLANYLENK
ncbi:MAG: acyl carrier protein [Bacteroidetes bacterium ADurb.Bin035]|nr:MAG: acyl carrier protein [Bacteroidetes bacterium ADurb.Bin035]